jgi:hypothetical protein
VPFLEAEAIVEVFKKNRRGGKPLIEKAKGRMKEKAKDNYNSKPKDGSNFKIAKIKEPKSKSEMTGSKK